MKCSKCGAILDGGRICQECGNEVVTDEMIHQEKIEVARKYADKIPSRSNLFYVKGDIPSVKINNAMSAYAPTLNRDTIIALYDTTITENGKEGFIVTDNEIYFKKYMEPAVRIKFSDIDNMLLWTFKLKDGSSEDFSVECSDNEFRHFVNELIDIDKKYGIKPVKRKRKITKLEVMEKYGRKLPYYNCDFYIRGTIPNKVLRNAIDRYAYEVSPGEVLGLVDTTIMDSGKTGILFTEEGFYQNIDHDVVRKIKYKDIIRMNRNGYTIEIEYWNKNLDQCIAKSMWSDLHSDVFFDFLNEMRKVDWD